MARNLRRVQPSVVLNIHPMVPEYSLSNMPATRGALMETKTEDLREQQRGTGFLAVVWKRDHVESKKMLFFHLCCNSCTSV